MGRSSFFFGERIPKKDPNDPNDHGWKPLYNGHEEIKKLSDDTLLGKKSVVFFPGGGALGEARANGCCKSAQGMLKLSGITEMPHLYGFGYVGKGHRYQRHEIATQLKQAQFGEEYVPEETEDPPYYQPFFEEYILPLFINEKGSARPLMEIKKNLQNITFVSYCQGGFLAWQIEKMMVDQLKKLYPTEVQQIMNNVRMIHFASRRPKGQAVSAKHLDILLQDDEVFGDDRTLEYDNIHRQLQRLPLPGGSALIAVSPNEEILFLKRVTPDPPNPYDKYLNHSQILQFFSGEYENQLPENEPALKIVRQLLRHFVEHPQDHKSVEEQLAALDPDFVKEKSRWRQEVLFQEQEDGKMRRGLLSLITDWGARLAHKRKKLPFKNKQFIPIEDMLRQHDDRGRFLYDELKKRYQQDRDPLSLIHYLKATHAEMPPEERGNLAVLAIQNHDWKLLESLGKKDATLLCIDPDQLQKVIFLVRPEDLYHILPLLKNNLLNLRKKPQALALLMRKTKKIKKEIHKKMLESFFNRQLENCFYTQKETLKSLLGLASLNEKKRIKEVLQEQRQKKAHELFNLKDERDTLAPDLLIQEYGVFREGKRHWKEATLDDFRHFKKQQQKDTALTFNAFMANKQK